MPPARARNNVDDSRSETSSTVTNQKDKALLGPSSGSGVAKSKKALAGVFGAQGTSSKAGANGATSAPASTATAPEKDPNLPHTDWTTVPSSILESYRTAHRLPIPSAYARPHASIIYSSSTCALRAPSAVLARRRQRDERHKRQKFNGTAVNGNRKASLKYKDKIPAKERQKPKDEEPSDPPLPTAPPSSQDRASPSAPSTASTYLGPREPPENLANSVRKHFNAQQLNEVDTIARFIYVVQQNGRSVSVEGSAGDGTGWWMGSHGREVRKMDGPGGEVGFRLRFRP